MQPNLLLALALPDEALGFGWNLFRFCFWKVRFLQTFRDVTSLCCYFTGVENFSYCNYFSFAFGATMGDL